MIKCPFCHVEQVPNTIYCSECGQFLLEEDKRKTDLYPSSEIKPVRPAPEKPEGSSTVRLDSQPLLLCMRIGSAKREVEIPLNKNIGFGRVDPALDVFPEIDLTHEGPAAKSVSRRHAAIFKQESKIVIEDLGSVNGTFINGRRLDPYLPEVLQSGDTIQLGKILIEVEIRRQQYNLP